MREERLEVSVTFDERHGYIGSDCGRRWSRFSLGGLRRRIEALMVPDSVDVVLQLDGLAERDSPPGAGAAKQNCAAYGLPSRTNVCTRRKRTSGPQGGSPGLDTELTPTTLRQ